ncbi:MAG: cellulase family glycosylhydrolase [Candidatus Saccharibacteria bacterium]
MKQLTFIFLLLFATATIAKTPPNRIRFNKQNIFLNGSNSAWINFANDIGPDSEINIEGFRKSFAEIHASGGNAMRIWLHTTGQHSPMFNEAGEVTGPGQSTISDVKALLDAAWENNVGLELCLWSFDMLRQKNGEKYTTRAKHILSDRDATMTYVNNSLIPMVKELKGHPAIIAWEIFNEPEGMSNEFGWAFNDHVPMADIQRFINLCAGAIHRTDPSALVTNGSWSFLASTDVGAKNKNYYTDARLIEAGGDKDGVLDFYTVHYYDWAKEALSPFHHDASYWQLDKPVAITEFFAKTTFGVDELSLHEELYKRGYAGAQSWSWTDSNHEKMLINMKDMFEKHRKDVEIKKK